MEREIMSVSHHAVEKRSGGAHKPEPPPASSGEDPSDRKALKSMRRGETQQITSVLLQTPSSTLHPYLIYLLLFSLLFFPDAKKIQDSKRDGHHLMIFRQVSNQRNLRQLILSDQ